MKKQPIFFLFFLGAFLAVFSGCMKKQNYSVIPQISFLSFENVYDTGQFPKNGILSIYYQDGDGDIGLDKGDTFPPLFDSAGPYYYNFVITYFEKQNGVFIQPVLAFPLSARIPVLTPDDPNKPIKGYIQNTLPMPLPSIHDTIKYEAFIYDRALNKSNVITTPEIILRRK